jgi:hypothetical protein
VEVAIQEHGLQIHVIQSFQASVAGGRCPSGKPRLPENFISQLACEQLIDVHAAKLLCNITVSID